MDHLVLLCREVAQKLAQARNLASTYEQYKHTLLMSQHELFTPLGYHGATIRRGRPAIELGIAYFGNRILRHAEAELDEIAATGFAHVLHTFSESDQRFYRDQMARFVDATHSRGMSAAAAPFGMAGIFGGEEASFFLAEHPSERQQDNLGRTYTAACLRSPATRALVQSWLADAAATGFDEVLWDEPAWAFDTNESARCTCRYCKDEQDDAEAGLVGFLSDAVGMATAYGLRSTVCLLPDELASTPRQPWEAVARIARLDGLSADPYWKNAFLPAAPFVEATLHRVTSAVRETDVAPECWIQGFGLQEIDLPDFESALLGARKAGARRAWVWAFDAAAHMSELGETSPERVWKEMKNIARSFAIDASP